MRLFAFLTVSALLIIGWNGSVAHAAGSSTSSHCDQLRENQTETLADIHNQKQKRAFDASNDQLLYQMAQSDGTGLAQVPAPAWLENQQAKTAKSQPSSQSEHQTGPAEDC